MIFQANPQPLLSGNSDIGLNLHSYSLSFVVNIVVNAEGSVIESNYNNSSTSVNGCLIDHALEYAKASTFTPNSSKPRQLGTITFIFKGKR